MNAVKILNPEAVAYPLVRSRWWSFLTLSYRSRDALWHGAPDYIGVQNFALPRLALACNSLGTRVKINVRSMVNDLYVHP